MINLLDETIEEMSSNGYSFSDVKFIGSSDGLYSCSVEGFMTLANRTYDNGFGAPKVAQDLVIVFAEGSSMYRHEYDGAESWRHSLVFSERDKTVPIKSLFAQCVGWECLSEINGAYK